MSADSLADMLARALDDVQSMGGPERARLAELIGKPAYDRLTSGVRGADLIQRWLDASGKTKPAATKALSIYIAKVADKPDLVDRITREIGDNFDIDMPPTLQPKSVPPRASEKPTHGKQQTDRAKKPAKADIAMLAAGDDMAGYVKARIQKSEL